MTPQSISENIRYFMYKYNLLYSDWYNDLRKVYLKIDAYVHSITNYEDRCIAGAIRELCESHNRDLPQFVEAIQLYSMIDMLCTT